MGPVSTRDDGGVPTPCFSATVSSKKSSMFSLGTFVVPRRRPAPAFVDKGAYGPFSILIAASISMLNFFLCCSPRVFRKFFSPSSQLTNSSVSLTAAAASTSITGACLLSSSNSDFCFCRFSYCCCLWWAAAPLLCFLRVIFTQSVCSLFNLLW